MAVAGVADPDVRQSLTGVSSEAIAPARAVVAVGVLEARTEAVLQIEGHGATVIDADRRHLNAACVAAYLDAKSRVRF